MNFRHSTSDTSNSRVYLLFVYQVNNCGQQLQRIITSFGFIVNHFIVSNMTTLIEFIGGKEHTQIGEHTCCLY